MLTMASEFQLTDPAATYERPFDVLRDATLSDREKVDVLKQWLDNAVRDRLLGRSDIDRVCDVTKALRFMGAAV